MDLPMFNKDSKIKQGQSGNCWLISSLIALEKHITFCEKNNIIYLVTTEKGTVKFNKLIEKVDENHYNVYLKDIDLKVLKLGFSDFYYTNDDIMKILKMKIENKIVIVSINSSRKLPTRCDICKKFKHNHTYCVEGIEGNKVLIRDPVAFDIIFLDFFKFLDIFNCI